MDKRVKPAYDEQGWWERAGALDIKPSFPDKPGNDGY
jgi:hypothetical protein